MDRQTNGNLTNGWQRFLNRERGKEKRQEGGSKEEEIKEKTWLWKET